MSVVHLASGRGAHRRAACDSRQRYRDPIVVETVGEVSCFFCRRFIRRIYPGRRDPESWTVPTTPKGG